MSAVFVGNPARPATRAAVFINQNGALLTSDSADFTDPQAVRFVPGALRALVELAARGFALLVVSNQSGLAQGHFSRAQFARVQAGLQRRLTDEAGIVLTDWTVCPHAPAADGRPACLCRMPAPGLLVRAARSHDIDLARSWMVGGTLDDVEAGRRAGCRSLFFDCGEETVWRRSPLRTPHQRCTDWESAAQLISADTAQMPTAAAAAELV